MENNTIARTIRLFAQLLELHGENTFRIRAVANAAFTIDKLPFKLSDTLAADLECIKGIGKSLAAKISELIETGQISEMSALLTSTPAGVVEMMQIKGLGPKKIQVIWKDMGLDNIGELYYACNENRLIEAKGFGLKTQEEIKKMIEFRMAGSGKFIYARVQPIANMLFGKIALWLNEYENEPLLGLAGAYRRGCEIIESLNFIIGYDGNNSPVPHALNIAGLSITSSDGAKYTGVTEEGLNINITLVPKAEFYYHYFVATGSLEHVKKVLIGSPIKTFNSEEAIYAAAGFQYVVPEQREDAVELIPVSEPPLLPLISFKDLKGALHNHSTWSDGVHTLEEMAQYTRDHMKLEYLGISDHSKTAFYARGLTEQQIIGQHAEIDRLNQSLAPFLIFKGIESDILNDGSLDYSDKVLETFDFVIASIHSNLKMNEEKATERLLKAIENPFTTILGHPTGRLLLSRSGYAIDHKKVIDACAANQVVIEINANPLRLDLDWRWHRYALDNGVILSVNPDAHRKEGLHDMEFGIVAARKGGLTPANCLNCKSAIELDAFFQKRKSRHGK